MASRDGSVAVGGFRVVVPWLAAIGRWNHAKEKLAV